MAADWRTSVNALVGEAQRTTAQTQVAPALRQALNNLRAFSKERRGAADTSRQIKEKAVYGNYPELAASDIGVELPTGAGGLGGGFDDLPLEKVVRGKGTKTERTYKAPETLDEAGIARIWTDYITKLQSQNAMNSKYPNYTPIPIPNLVDFTQAQFPEYMDLIRKKGGAEPDLAAVQGKVDELRDKGKTDVQIIALLKKSKFKGIAPSLLGLTGK